jgi:hypothetical protein
MIEGKSQIGVGRREFYSTTATVYVFIGLAGLASARVEDSWYRYIPALFTAMAAIACSFIYSCMAWRQKSKEGS